MTEAVVDDFYEVVRPGTRYSYVVTHIAGRNVGILIPDASVRTGASRQTPYSTERFATPFGNRTFYLAPLMVPGTCAVPTCSVI